MAPAHLLGPAPLGRTPLLERLLVLRRGLALGTIAAIFCFGALLILCFQGYPLIGVTLMSLGGLLCGGALTCAAWGLIRRKKTEEKTAVLENEVDTDDEPEEDDFTDEAVEAEEDEHDQIA